MYTQNYLFLTILFLGTKVSAKGKILVESGAGPSPVFIVNNEPIRLSLHKNQFELNYCLLFMNKLSKNGKVVAILTFRTYKMSTYRFWEIRRSATISYRVPPGELTLVRPIRRKWSHVSSFKPSSVIRILTGVFSHITAKT